MDVVSQPNARESLTVRAAPGTRYQPLYKKGDPVPAAIRLDDGALLIEFQRSLWRQDFQILTPLAIAAVRGTKWAVEVTRARTSVLVLSDAFLTDQWATFGGTLATHAGVTGPGRV